MDTAPEEEIARAVMGVALMIGWVGIMLLEGGAAKEVRAFWAAEPRKRRDCWWRRLCVGGCLIVERMLSCEADFRRRRVGEWLWLLLMSGLCVRDWS